MLPDDKKAKLEQVKAASYAINSWIERQNEDIIIPEKMSELLDMSIWLNHQLNNVVEDQYSDEVMDDLLQSSSLELILEYFVAHELGFRINRQYRKLPVLVSLGREGLISLMEGVREASRVTKYLSKKYAQYSL